MKKLYIGVDVGGTKIQANLVAEDGAVRADNRHDTPRNCGSEVSVNAVEESIRTLLYENNLTVKDIGGIGIAVPGLVVPETGYVVVTPNMNLSNVELGKILKKRLGITVAVGNDCNLGTLGEFRYGSGRGAKSVVGIFVGTGIGSGIVIDGKVIGGAACGAGEIGHIVARVPVKSWKNFLDSAQFELPKKAVKCGCGNYGCLESLASRTAIERMIREGLADGVKSVIKAIDNDAVIKSGALLKALKANDPLVTAVMRYASYVIGYGCLTVRHLLDPEVIVLGGGVIEACHKFMLPIIDEVVQGDQLAAAKSDRRITVAELGDNAVAVGAAALNE
ncbi:MAG: ROK family protein [Planctomycetaceae bacterium]|jgi:glucokinase|nr:ROK family protein [Planctomycetaceae bacterium]